MSDLPLARLSNVIAVSEGNNLILYVEGITDGAGGSFVARRNLNMIQPNPIHIYARDGNLGINPEQGLRDQPTRGAFVFAGDGQKAQITVACAAVSSPNTAPPDTASTIWDRLGESGLINGHITVEVVHAEPAENGA